MDIIFCYVLILYQILFSPQVKKNVIISNKHGIYKLTLELQKDLRLRILRKKQRSGNSENFKEL